MTITLKAEYLKNNTIQVSIRQNKDNPLYIVSAAEADNSRLYPITTNSYSTLEKARRRYNTLKRKYK